jgi:hypothetical protein
MMAELLDATETDFDTDFAILNAAQDGVDGARAGTFAGSAVGAVSAHCGAKYALVHVRAERWSSRPDAGGNWEDIDELPFTASEGAGPLHIWGFDPPDDDHGLDLNGFTTGRVLVRARGRHRYEYSDDEVDLPAEEWLLQFFPEPGPTDPLAGSPRRLVAYSPFSAWEAPSGWRAAIHSWVQSGWDSHLQSSPGYQAIRFGIGTAMQPVSARDLANLYARSPNYRSPTSVPFPADPLEIAVRQQRDDPLAGMHGSAVVDLGAAIDALRELQLLLEVRRAGKTLLVPNPAPAFVWDVASLSEKEVQGLQRQIRHREFVETAEDITSAVEWAGDAGLKTTVQEMGIRWSKSSADIRGGLALVALTEGVTVSPQLSGGNAAEDVLPILVSRKSNDEKGPEHA